MTVPMVETKINGRWRLLLPEHRAERPEWVTGWERERLDSMHEHLSRMAHQHELWLMERGGPDAEKYTQRTRPVIVDVGVEEGDLTALYSQWGCDVVMVEPNPRVWPNVRAIWQANGLRPPLASWVGFAGESYTYEIEQEWLVEHVLTAGVPAEEDYWPACAYGRVIGDHAFLHLAQHAHMVPTITLDRLVDNVRWADGVGRKIDAITMDVEGSELRVLRGAERILREDRPLVWVSVHTDDQWMAENYAQDRRGDIDAFMAELGYVPHLLAVDHEEHVFYQPQEAAR